MALAGSCAGTPRRIGANVGHRHKENSREPMSGVNPGIDRIIQVSRGLQFRGKGRLFGLAARMKASFVRISLAAYFAWISPILSSGRSISESMSFQKLVW
jgi:hypothetical protein